MSVIKYPLMLMHAFESSWVCYTDSLSLTALLQVIYVARNPKDVLVSYYHFHKYATMLQTPKNFTEFFENFMEGNGKNNGIYMIGLISDNVRSLLLLLCISLS